jgi:POT family proton-dependent oligopeptide transporter
MLSTLKQPKPFYLVFSIELWERFGYYGMQALIVLFFVKHLNYTDEQADNLFAAFAALVYIFPTIGGYIGDRLLGTKRTIIFGTVLLILGYSFLAMPLDINIYIPLSFIAVGVGLFKPNPASLLSKIYQGDESKLDGGFTLYYMAVNIGSFLSMALVPIISSIYGWHVAFAICAIGLVVALVVYLSASHLIKHYGSPPDFEPLQYRLLFLVICMVVALTCLSAFLLYHYTLSGWMIMFGGMVILAIFLSEILKSPEHEKRSLILCLILIFQAIIFFVLYFQMPTSLNLFALRNVEHSLWGIHIEAASYQAFNSFWIMVLSPLLAIAYNWLSLRNNDPSMPTKFAVGTFLTGLAFLVLPFAAKYYAIDGLISGWWLVLFYLLQSAGELLVSALGLAMVARFVPERLMGFMMGTWFLCSAIGGIIAGKVASLSAIPQNITSPVESLPIYTHLFSQIGVITIGISLLMALFVPALKKLDDTEEAKHL